MKGFLYVNIFTKSPCISQKSVNEILKYFHLKNQIIFIEV